MIARLSALHVITLLLAQALIGVVMKVVDYVCLCHGRVWCCLAARPQQLDATSLDLSFTEFERIHVQHRFVYGSRGHCKIGADKGDNLVVTFSGDIQCIGFVCCIDVGAILGHYELYFVLKRFRCAGCLNRLICFPRVWTIKCHVSRAGHFQHEVEGVPN